nr:hypothetical protein [Enterococcus innesii]
MEKTLKKLAKVIDRMMDHVDLYGGPSVVSDDDLEHYLDPVFYLIFCAETDGGMTKLKDKSLSNRCIPKCCLKKYRTV